MQYHNHNAYDTTNQDIVAVSVKLLSSLSTSLFIFH